MREAINEIISVIIPIYNVEKYLEECIESVLSQSYKNYEIILVNDGSTDTSKEIAEYYADKYANIHCINQKNMGLAAARNVGMEAACGKYIYFLDSDDKIHDTLFEQCIDKFNKYEIDIIHFGYNLLSNNEIIKKSILIGYDVIYTGMEFFEKSSEKALGQNFEVWTYMYKKDFLKKNNLYFKDGIVYEDAEIYIRILMNNPNIFVLNKHLHLYRVRKDSIVNKEIYDYKYLHSINLIIDNYLHYMDENAGLEYEFKRYISRLIRAKFNVLMKLEKLTAQILDVEIYNIMRLKNKLNIEVDGVYLKELEQVVINKSISSDIFNRKDIKEEISEIDRLRYENVSILPLLNDEKAIGIYGIGSHTKALLTWYKKNVGNIKSQVFLIDSTLSDRYSEEYDLNIININNVSNYNLDCVVLSGPYSEHILYENLIKVNYIGKIYRLYENNNNLLFL